jgi:RNA polymerase sigma factor (sigma-70 family)
MKEKIMEYSRKLPEGFTGFQDGNETVWQQIVLENSQWLFSLCLRIVRHPNDAEDIVQETFLQAFRARKQLKNFDNLRSWLRKICVRLAIRRPRRRQTVSLDEVNAFIANKKTAFADQSASTKEELELVLNGLSKLSQRQRVCLILAVFEELSINEIANELGISTGAVKRYIFEARQTLQKFFKYGVQ